jgi:hypothetical protein
MTASGPECRPSLADATPEEIAAYNDKCAICRDSMQAAKRLPCGHMFHGCVPAPGASASRLLTPRGATDPACGPGWREVRFALCAVRPCCATALRLPSGGVPRRPHLLVALALRRLRQPRRGSSYHSRRNRQRRVRD